MRCIIAVCVLALLGAVFAVHRYVDRNYAQPSRDLSKMMSVRTTVGGALSAHYEQHGSYPHSLTELPLQTLKWGDEGSSVQDLQSWRYTSDGRSFTMSWDGARNTRVFLGGRSGQLYYTEDVSR